MSVKDFLRLLTKEVGGYKDLFETADGQWVVKGFIDISRNVYGITGDTKVVSKLIEILLIPRLKAFAARHGMTMEQASKQNYYPDLTFGDEEGHLFAVDFKSSYYSDGAVNGLTLGSYWGYFRERDKAHNTDRPYGAYSCHIVLGILYRRNSASGDNSAMFGLDDLPAVQSVIEQFVFFVQPKWKIADDRPGSGNTRNIGSITTVEDLIAGRGPFASLGETVFDDYWTGYFNKADARAAGLGEPRYHNLETYKEYLARQKDILDKMR